MHLSIDEITASISGKDIPATQGEEHTNSTPNSPVETSPIVPEISIPKPTQEAKPTQDSIPSNPIKEETDLTDSTINPQPAPSSQKMLVTTGANVFLISGLGALIALAGLFTARSNRKKNRTA